MLRLSFLQMSVKIGLSWEILYQLHMQVVLPGSNETGMGFIATFGGDLPTQGEVTDCNCLVYLKQCQYIFKWL